MIIAVLSGNYLKDTHTRNPERTLSKFESGEALTGIYSWGWINMSFGAMSSTLGWRCRRFESKGDISTAFDGVDQPCHKSPAPSEVRSADFDRRGVLEESSFMLWRILAAARSRPGRGTIQSSATLMRSGKVSPRRQGWRCLASPSRWFVKVEGLLGNHKPGHRPRRQRPSAGAI